jgi:hypothetical protein
MSLPLITLSAGQVLVTKATITPQGVVPQDEGYILGLVVAVCDTCDLVSLGNYIMFKESVAFGILSGGTYYIVNQSDSKFQETPPL